MHEEDTEPRNDPIDRGEIPCPLARTVQDVALMLDEERLGGNIIVTETSDEIRFETEASVDEMSLRMAGNGSQVFMVAGA